MRVIKFGNQIEITIPIDPKPLIPSIGSKIKSGIPCLKISAAYDWDGDSVIELVGEDGKTAAFICYTRGAVTHYKGGR